MNRLRQIVSWDTRRLSSLGYRFFSHPEICSGDQSRISLLATMSRNLWLAPSRHLFGRKAEVQAWCMWTSFVAAVSMIQARFWKSLCIVVAYLAASSAMPNFERVIG
jgi:hypothetical protein